MKNKIMGMVIGGVLVAGVLGTVSAYSTSIWSPIQFVKQLFVTPNGELDSSKATIKIDGTNGTIQSKGITLNGDWLRIKGNNGVYFQDHGGGWNMTDGTWIRSYGNKNIYVNKMIRADDGFQVDGKQVISSDGGVHTAKISTNSHYGYFEVRRANGDRGAYFGWGNGGNTVNLNLDKASMLSINKNVSIGGHLTVGGTPVVTARALNRYATKSYVDTHNKTNSSLSFVSVCNSRNLGKPNSLGYICENNRVTNEKHCWNNGEDGVEFKIGGLFGFTKQKCAHGYIRYYKSNDNVSEWLEYKHVGFGRSYHFAK